ncbi:hypothetical protein ACFY05_32960 [Microtetraspora fusca]|uniref:Uncharacterized protein n=1 Tax=Microtetraspora fusca TaxID=1997 RepID=A0ABW6VE78_MICFU
MTYPPFGLTEPEAETLIRFAAAFGDEALSSCRSESWNGELSDAAWATIESFSDGMEVLKLGAVTWKTIETIETGEPATATPPQQARTRTPEADALDLVRRPAQRGPAR